MEDSKPLTIDEYISGFPAGIQGLLQDIRTVIQKAAPDAKETIRYAIPTFTLNGNLIHFAAFKHHIGIYPTPTGIDAFKAELSGYTTAKGSIRIPLDEPMPLALISRIVEYRVKQNTEKRRKD